jgi:hypothetical protein
MYAASGLFTFSYFYPIYTSIFLLRPRNRNYGLINHGLRNTLYAVLFVYIRHAHNNSVLSFVLVLTNLKKKFMLIMFLKKCVGEIVITLFFHHCNNQWLKNFGILYDTLISLCDSNYASVIRWVRRQVSSVRRFGNWKKL